MARKRRTKNNKADQLYLNLVAALRSALANYKLETERFWRERRKRKRKRRSKR